MLGGGGRCRSGRRGDPGFGEHCGMAGLAIHFLLSVSRVWVVSVMTTELYFQFSSGFLVMIGTNLRVPVLMWEGQGWVRVSRGRSGIF